MQFTLGEEEIADVSLATFHLFDKENAQPLAAPSRWLGAAAVAVAAAAVVAAVAGLPWLRRLRGCGGLLRILGRLPPLLSRQQFAIAH